MGVNVDAYIHHRRVRDVIAHQFRHVVTASGLCPVGPCSYERGRAGVGIFGGKESVVGKWSGSTVLQSLNGVSAPIADGPMGHQDEAKMNEPVF